MYHLPLPPHYKDQKYSKLFRDLAIERCIIPLGLYRTHTVDEKRKIKYVVTNPSKDTKLNEDDILFVLAQEDPTEGEWEIDLGSHRGATPSQQQEINETTPAEPNLPKA